MFAWLMGPYRSYMPNKQDDVNIMGSSILSQTIPGLQANETPCRTCISTTTELNPAPPNPAEASQRLPGRRDGCGGAEEAEGGGRPQKDEGSGGRSQKAAAGSD